jgi:hypothetical protein
MSQVRQGQKRKLAPEFIFFLVILVMEYGVLYSTKRGFYLVEEAKTGLVVLKQYANAFSVVDTSYGLWSTR